MSKHIEVEYMSDINIEELEVGDTVHASNGFDRENKIPGETGVTYQLQKPNPYVTDSWLG